MSSLVIASKAKQSSADHAAHKGLDCFVASLLAMTVDAGSSLAMTTLILLA